MGISEGFDWGFDWVFDWEFDWGFDWDVPEARRRWLPSFVDDQDHCGCCSRLLNDLLVGIIS